MPSLRNYWRRPRQLLTTLHRRDGAMLVVGIMLAVGSMEVIRMIHNSQTPLPYHAGITSPWIPASVKRWQPTINEMSKKYNMDPNLVAIVITLESGGSAKANSGVAHGLMQITPLTAKDIASKHLKQPRRTYDLWDPRTNIEFGVAYLAYLRSTFGSVRQGPSWNSTVELMAAGHNGGPGASNSLEQGNGLRDTQTVIYSRDAFDMWRERHAATSPTYSRWLERGGTVLIEQAKAEQARHKR